MQTVISASFRAVALVAAVGTKVHHVGTYERQIAGNMLASVNTFDYQHLAESEYTSSRRYLLGAAQVDTDPS